MSGRMQRRNEEREFLHDGERAVVAVGHELRHSAQPLLWTETCARQRPICAGTQLADVRASGSTLLSCCRKCLR